MRFVHPCEDPLGTIFRDAADRIGVPQVTRLLVKRYPRSRKRAPRWHNDIHYRDAYAQWFVLPPFVCGDINRIG